MTKKHLVTSALPYINNIPHLGNFIPLLRSDIYTRILKLQGENVLYICATDESGTRTEIEAEKKQMTEEKYCKIMHKKIKDILIWFNIGVDYFGRTSSKSNHELTKEIFLDLHKQGYICEKEITLLYCPNCKRYLPDSYVEGICPFCKKPGAKGDQCDNCSKFINPEELIDPKCKLCGQTPVIKKDKHLFLDLPKFSGKLKKYIEGNRNFRGIEKNLPLAWIKDGLEPRCISRNLSWGVKIPLEGYENKVFYVWFDAPIGYIAATKDYCDKNNLDYKDYWQNKNSEIIHFMGKDNVPFHTIIWPAELMSSKKWNLPSRIYSNEFLNYEKGKFSKSNNRGVFCDDVMKLSYNSDTWRFYLASVLPEGKDSDFEWQEFMEKINNELIANYANFTYRITSIAKRFGQIEPIDKGKLSKKEKDISNKIKENISNYLNENIKGNIKESLRNALNVSSLGNQYFQENKPWELIKDESKKEEANHVLWFSFLILLNASVLLYPFMPAKTKEIIEQIDSSFNMSNCLKEKIPLELEKNILLREAKPLFKKIEEKEIEELKKRF
ncbi:MAG: methionine--tRNA ligase [Candidatus Nanohalarchaeota archaeon]|nr:MAG: methionine--tRNA ligase [Candidatus Nanohaloarchaeota archaeon]